MQIFGKTRMIWVLPALFGYYPHYLGTTRIMRVIPAGTNVGLRVMQVRVNPAGTCKKKTRYPSLIEIIQCHLFTPIYLFHLIPHRMGETYVHTNFKTLIISQGSPKHNSERLCIH